MKTRCLTLIAGILLSASCNLQERKAPDYLLEQDRMVAVMVDMHLVETAGNLKLIGPDSTSARYGEMFASIFETHGVSKMAFDSSLYYYATQTQQMDSIYDMVLEELSELESEVSAGHR